MQPGNPLLLTNGQRVFSRYRLKMLVGKGASGIVWRARDEELETDIALKFLAEDFLYDASALADLKRETRRGMALAHPGIVRIFGFFQDGNQAAIAMEYVEGNTVAGLQSSRRDKIFEVHEITEWTRQLCAALHYAHTEAQLVHRDLKPGNLLIDDRGRIKIADFGIAAGINDAHTRVVGSAEARGTLAYMSPQQLLGQHACVAHDVYSVGATLYELLTGRPPFYSGDISLQVRTVVPSTLAQRRAEFRVTGAAIPEIWERAIAACLEKDASLRPASAAEIAQQLGIGDSGSFPVRVSGPLPQIPAAEAPLSASGNSLDSGIHPRITPASSAPTVILQSPASTATREKPRTLWWIAGGALAASVVFGAAGFGLYWGARAAKNSPSEIPSAPSSAPAVAPQRKIEPPAPSLSTPAVNPEAPAASAPESPPELQPPAQSSAVHPSPVLRQSQPAKENRTLIRRTVAPRVVANQLQPERATPEVESPGPSNDNPPLAEPGGNGDPMHRPPPGGRGRSGPGGFPPPPDGDPRAGAQRPPPQEGPAARPNAPVRAQPVLARASTLSRLAVLDRPEPDHPFVLPESEIAMMWIPAGRDAMGAPPEVQQGPDDERPFTEVSFPEGIWMGKFEVSRREYRAIVGAVPTPIGGVTDDTPVTNVNWSEAMLFCERLTAAERNAGRLPEGYVYTLPTEAQWEYALKSGMIGPSAPYQSLDGAAWGSFAGTTVPQPRGQLAASPWGLYDMYGNVAEWCYDWYESQHPGGQVIHYAGPRSGSRRVVKGGSFRDDERAMHPSARSSAPPLQRSVTIGFRIVLAPKP